jgi:hypothetical protein
MHNQEATYTVILTPTHMRAAEAFKAPIAILHDDPLFEFPAELRMTANEARALAAHLIRLADAA